MFTKADLEYEDFIKLFTHEISYNLKMLGVSWRARYEIVNESGTALTVIRGNHGDFPPISIFDYYEEFLQGTPWGVAARKATEEFFNERITKYALKDIGVFQPDMVIPSFVNAEENAEMLDKIPHLKFEDLAIILRVVYQSLGGINLDLMVTGELLEEWNLDFGQLYQITLDNSKNIESVQVIELYKIMAEMIHFKASSKDMPIFLVVTNTNQHWGAASILYKDKMNELAEIMGTTDVLLVPMSADNILAMPHLDDDGIRNLVNALHDSNKLITGSAKSLSENIYCYSSVNNQFHMISSHEHKLKDARRYGR